MLNFSWIGSAINLFILSVQLLGGQAFAIPPFASSPKSHSPTPLCPSDLEVAIASVIERPQFQRTRWGILVESLGSSRDLYALNPRQYFIPASSVKLLTTAAALLKLNPYRRIRTSIYGSASPSTVTSLRVVGRGDPTMTTVELEALAQQLKHQGIRRVPQLIVEDNYLPAPPLNPTWEWEDVYAYYGAAVNSAILNQNAFTLTVLPQQIGQSVQVRWSDAIAARQWRIENQGITAPARTPYGINITGSLGQPVLTITGELAIDAEPDTWRLAIADPGQYFLESFRQTLLSQGIMVDRGLVESGGSPAPSLLERELAVIYSPPLTELIEETNQESNNLYAEVLLKLLGTVSVTGEGLEVLQQSLSELGVDSSSYVLVDGSGLSRHNLLSPEGIVQTLQLMAQSPDAEIYQHSLSLAGVSGTLQGRFQDTAVEENLRAKTGTLTGISALSGYLDVPDYQPLVFSILLNHSDQPVAVQRAAVDEIVLTLSRLQFC